MGCPCHAIVYLGGRLDAWERGGCLGFEYKLYSSLRHGSAALARKHQGQLAANAIELGAVDGVGGALLEEGKAGRVVEQIVQRQAVVGDGEVVHGAKHYKRGGWRSRFFVFF